MIVPHTRLLGWFGAVGLPLLLLAALSPSVAPAAWLALAVLGALAVLDIALAFGRSTPLTAAMDRPAMLTQGRAGAARVVLLREAPAARPLRLRLGLALPAGIESEIETRDIEMPAGARQFELDWPLRSQRRGRYRLPICFVERVSPLGCWLVRARLPLAGEVRVYPDLRAERRGLAALFLPRGTLGTRRRRQLGKGREFEKLREYVPGDDLADIHWKTTAKRGRPITKLYQIERTQEVYLVIDTSRLSARAFGPDESPGATTLDRFLSAALVTCLAAQRQGDLFGLITFSDKVDRFIPARNGRAHYNLCRDALYHLEARPVTPDFDELFTTVRLRLRRRALLICLTSLDDPTLAESFQQRLALVRRHHLVLVNMIAPPEARELFDAPDLERAEDLPGRLGGHLAWQELRLLEQSLARVGVRFAALEHASLVTSVVNQYLEIKQRQML